MAKKSKSKPTIRRGMLCVLDGQAFAKVKSIDGDWITFVFLAGVEPANIGSTTHDTIDGNVVVLQAKTLEHAIYEYAQREKEFDDAAFNKAFALRDAAHRQKLVLAETINELSTLKDHAETMNDLGMYYALKAIGERLERGRQRLLDGLEGKVVDDGN